ncbi:MAG: hypothetical protein KDB03_05360 [Planctomycetales bacterium]|nr:hypothetical protein [Planctomycetales bacterium]
MSFHLYFRSLSLLSWFIGTFAAIGTDAQDSKPVITLPESWTYSAPLIVPENRPSDISHAQKDPTIVFAEGAWHVFMTVKLENRSAIEYCSFQDWQQADAAPRHLLPLSSSNYFCAPQVFFYEPQSQWYLIYQASMPDAKKMWVAYSTTKTISDPNSWSTIRPILDGGPEDERIVGGLDFWIICDHENAYLFFTSLNGKLWRMSAPLDSFPHGFTECTLALQGEFFEASHTYRLQGLDQYLTLIEVDGRRYFKAFISDRLDGKWQELLTPAGLPFASWKNIHPGDNTQNWTDNISHGELLRSGSNQLLEVDPANLQFLFQGMLDSQKSGLPYGRFPWRIGLLRPNY